MLSRNRGLHLAIDASNIQSGGGLTHLTKLLEASKPQLSGINKITLWSNKATIDALPEFSWLFFKNPSWIERNLFVRFFMQQLFFVKSIEKEGCDVLFSPGGTIPINCNVPVITMSQNMLPFEINEAMYFGRFSLMRLKMWLLKFIQGKSLKNSNGVIFLTNYAEKFISKNLETIFENKIIIPHGIEERFFQKPKRHSSLNKYNEEKPLKLLYVSILMPYKHQIEIAKAAKILYEEGLNIEIKFVGENWRWYGKKFLFEIESLDPNSDFLIWNGFVSFKELHMLYKGSDVFVFGSSCENLPNILIEAMAAGMPIASSNFGPMPEVLRESAVYFNPTQVPSIVNALRKISVDENLRNSLAVSSWKTAKSYSWDKCAKETLDFIYKTFYLSVK